MPIPRIATITITVDSTADAKILQLDLMPLLFAESFAVHHAVDIAFSNQRELLLVVIGDRHLWDGGISRKDGPQGVLVGLIRIGTFPLRIPASSWICCQWLFPDRPPLLRSEYNWHAAAVEDANEVTRISFTRSESEKAW